MRNRITIIALCLVCVCSTHAMAFIMDGDFVRTQIADTDGTLGNGKANPGLRHDPDGTGSFPTEDYLTPGTAREGFTISHRITPSGGAFSHYNLNDYLKQISHISFDNRSGDIFDHDHRWSGQIAGRYRIDQQAYFNDDDEFIMFVMKFTAISALYDVRYARYIDPDPDRHGGGGHNTKNTRGNVAASLPDADIVSAEGAKTGLTVGLYSQSAMPHNT
ncbi:MAG: hypothetical protein O3A01_05215, partial [bacterium]|nr:hypothetical protein [bacterium]